MPLRVVFALLLACLTSGASFGGEDHVAVSVGRLEDGFVVSAEIDAPVSQRTAWDVMVDYDHMSSIVQNLTLSKIMSRDGNITGRSCAKCRRSQIGKRLLQAGTAHKRSPANGDAEAGLRILTL